MVDIEPDHARICSDVGLSLEGPVQNFTLRVPCVTPGELDGVYKRIVLAVKSPATAESVSAIISHLDSMALSCLHKMVLTSTILRKKLEKIA